MLPCGTPLLTGRGGEMKHSLFIYLTFFVTKTASIYNKKHNIFLRKKIAKPKDLKQAAVGNLEKH